jgi:phosphatidylglycerophosphate synthase
MSPSKPTIVNRRSGSPSSSLQPRTAAVPMPSHSLRDSPQVSWVPSYKGSYFLIDDVPGLGVDKDARGAILHNHWNYYCPKHLWILSKKNNKKNKHKKHYQYISIISLECQYFMSKISLREIKEKYNYSASDTWYARIVCRKFSPFFTWVFYRTPITPNQITFLMILTGIAGGIFLAIPGYYNGLIGILFLQLFLVLDCVDGEIARSKQIFSTKGKFLDLIANDIVLVSIFTGLIFKFQNYMAAIAGFLAIIFFLMSKLFPFYAKGVDEKLTGEYLKPLIFNSKLKSAVFLFIKNITLPPTIILILTVAVVARFSIYVTFFYGIFFIFYYLISLILRLKK